MQISMTCWLVVLLMLGGAQAQTQLRPIIAQVTANDANVLQLSLTIERLSAYIYTTGQAKFTSDDFVEAGYKASVYTQFSIMRDQDKKHVDFLSNTIKEFNREPVSTCTYNLGLALSSVQTYIDFAAEFEVDKLHTYQSVAPLASDYRLIMSAASLSTIVARRAQYVQDVANHKYDSQLPTRSEKEADVATQTSRSYSATAFTTFASQDNATGSTSVAFVQKYRDTLTPACSNVAMPRQLFNIFFTLFSDENGAPMHTRTILSNDVLAAQYVQFIQYIQAAFYTYGSNAFDMSDFEEYGYDSGTLDLFKDFSNYTQLHLHALETYLGKHDTLLPCQYVFQQLAPDPLTFVTIAVKVKPLVTTALGGIVDTVTDPILRSLIISIAAGEGRQAATLSEIVSESYMLDDTEDQPFYNVDIPIEPTEAPAFILSALRSMNVFNISSPESCKLQGLPIRYNKMQFGTPDPSAGNVSAAVNFVCITILLFAILF